MPDGSVKLGFRAHYPQIETKLTVRGADMDDIERKLAPVVAEVRKRLGNFIMAEDDDTLEGVVLKALRDSGGSLAHGRDVHRAARSPRASRHLPGAETVFRRGIVARDLGRVVGRAAAAPTPRARSPARAPRRWRRRRAAQTGASHALAVLIDLDDGPDRIDFGGTICLAIATEDGRRLAPLAHSRRPRMGAARRRRTGPRLPAPPPAGLPVTERIDFERT